MSQPKYQPFTSSFRLKGLPDIFSGNNMEKYIPSKIEPKWQRIWREQGLYDVDLAEANKKFYLLVEFTYPSGDLHMGHWFAFAVPDILARMKRMQGYTVFAPNGFDAFGLPAENAALSRRIHPSDWTYGNIKRMKQQFSTMGATYDWKHEVITCDPEYFRWNQWIFLKMYERGLAYRAKAMANWCPRDQCVLANENVENGRCWRCGSEVVQKEVEQWFLKITDYAEKLLWSGDEDNPRQPQIDWPRSLKEGQNNWIGKSEGTEVEFEVKEKELKIKVFTTRPDTLFGATFMVLAPEHPLVPKITTKSQSKEVQEYQKASIKKSELARKEMKEKTGVFTGTYAVNPVNGEEIPIWTADYVLMGYGTGAIMAVPVHDERDFEFAKKYGLAIREVIKPFGKNEKDLKRAYVGEGEIVNSKDWNGLKVPDQVGEVIEWLEKTGKGKRQVQYHLRDWSISRQRYWGTPIPIIYCDNCGVVAVPEKDLPVELPYEVDFAPKGKPPLATAEDWVRVKCPNCAGEAKREVETMDTFIDSSWYFLRYVRKVKSQRAKVKSEERLPWDPELVKKWMPVDIYFGGAEHTLGHTLYSRFFVKFLQDIGALAKMPPTSSAKGGLRGAGEYAKKRVHHGVILGPDGARMSKSHGNIVNPDEEVKQYGADAVRMYLAFLGPYDLVAPWDPGGIRGVYNFLTRTWKLAEEVDGSGNLSTDDLHWMHKTIKKVTEDIESIKFNTAVAFLMEWLNYLLAKAHRQQETKNKKQETGEKVSSFQFQVSSLEYEVFLKLLAPFAPHITEELWQMLVTSNKKQETRNFDSVHAQTWPDYDPKLVASKQVTLVVQVNGKVRDKLPVEAGLSQGEAEKLALKSARVQKFLGSKKVQKVIYVADRLINLVV